MSKEQKQQFNLDMDAEVKARAAESAKPQVDANTSTEIAARIGELMRQSGVDDERNPIAAEKIQRDLTYQHQLETLPQPDSAPVLEPTTNPELDRLEQMQRELEAARAEATRWKKEFGRREGKVGGMESRIRELEARLGTMQPAIDVRAMTGLNPEDAITAKDVVTLLMAQSAALGNVIQQKVEGLANAGNSADPGLPLDLEAELVEAHPWLTDLPRPQKMRAMHDILGQAGVSVAPQAPGQPAAQQTQPVLPQAARAPLKQAAYIEPSNKGSVAEKNAVLPERQAFNDKVAELQQILRGPYKPGVTNRAAELLASLGAGPVDDSQQGFFSRR